LNLLSPSCQTTIVPSADSPIPICLYNNGNVVSIVDGLGEVSDPEDHFDSWYAVDPNLEVT
jgi:hypothetical protein